MHVSCSRDGFCCARLRPLQAPRGDTLSDDQWHKLLARNGAGHANLTEIVARDKTFPPGDVAAYARETMAWF